MAAFFPFSYNGGETDTSAERHIIFEESLNDFLSSNLPLDEYGEFDVIDPTCLEGSFCMQFG